MFQSTSASAGRRYLRSVTLFPGGPFQSTSASAGRRYRTLAHLRSPCRFQSTSASAGRRYSGLGALDRHCSGFNPLRPALAEDTHSFRAIRKMKSFNPLRPALAEDTFIGAVNCGSTQFQSTSASAGRRYRDGRRTAHRGRFQSTSASAGRRYFRLGWSGRRRCSFQSTSASAGRRYVASELCRWCARVSIHFGQRWPKIPSGYLISGHPEMFQSTSASAGRRYGKFAGTIAANHSFNPLRPALAEDTNRAGVVSKVGLFQSTSASAGRRYHRATNPREGRRVSIHFGQRWPKIHSAARLRHT